MRKALASALSILSIAVISSPAQATDWKEMGVSKRTGETVAIDIDSIDRRSQYDVRFRYLIGKDLVNATVNCASSLVKPDKGAAFVPDPTGATREMIKIACQASSGTIRREDSTPKARKFYVSDEAIREWRKLDSGNILQGLTDEGISGNVSQYCSAKSQGATRREMDDNVMELIMAQKTPQGRRYVEFHHTATVIIADQYVCPEYANQ